MGVSATTHYTLRSKARKPTGIIKLYPTISPKPRYQLRSLAPFFWYTSADGVTRFGASSGTPGDVQQINTYDFNPSYFVDEPYPSTFPTGCIWPPQELVHLVCAFGSVSVECVGDRCFTNTLCEDSFCSHTFENWQNETQNWQDHFELRTTEDRGTGVFTKRAFKAGDKLGWYAGELKPSSIVPEGDYIMDMEIGDIPIDGYSEFEESASEYGSDEVQDDFTYTWGPSEVTVMIDAAKKGNWTRFINHSCHPYSIFRTRRVGNIRIMTVEAIRDIPADVELTVNYGPDYVAVSSSDRVTSVV